MWVVICRCGAGSASGAGGADGATASRFVVVPPGGRTFLSESALRTLTPASSSRIAIAVAGRTFRSRLAAATRWRHRHDVVRCPNDAQIYLSVS